MIYDILPVIALLWLTFAATVGFHAKGHNRSGIVWFCIVAITGIIGLAIYLLAITSANSELPDDNRTFDDTVVAILPSATVGSICGLIVGLVLSGLLILLAEDLDSLREMSLLPILGFITGLVSGPIINSKFDIKQSYQDSVDLSRRQTLGVVGGSASLLIGGIILNADTNRYSNPKPKLNISNTSVQQDSGGAVVAVEIDNPRTEAVTVEVEVFVEVVKIDGGATGTRNEREEFGTFLTKTSTILSESSSQVELAYEVSEQDTLENIELSDTPAPSFSIQTDETS
jgi:hypothetical protein